MTFGGDWARFIDAIGPGFEKRLSAASRVEMNAVGRTAVRVARAMIRSRLYWPNAELTIRRKKSSTPLVDTNEMVNRIRHQLESGNLGVRIGTNRQAKKASKDGNIALWLHDGVKNKDGNGWKIRPRPFLTRPANDPEVQRALRDAGMKAIRRAVQGATK